MEPDLEAMLQRSDVPRVALTLARPAFPANGPFSELDRSPIV
jgi:hypothetical protein